MNQNPIPHTSEKSCPACLRSYKYPWGWILIWPTRVLVDLCPQCARVLRYGSESERQSLADELTLRFADSPERRAAA